jgi:hypothetical protein
MLAATVYKHPRYLPVRTPLGVTCLLPMRLIDREVPLIHELL